jgi:hypothetical protein
MKFILNESKRFILEERFILKEAEELTEATAAEVALSWTNKLKNTFANTEAVLAKCIEYAGASKKDTAKLGQFKKLQADLNAATQELENTMV